LTYLVFIIQINVAVASKLSKIFVAFLQPGK